jgi:hypothetical protein
MAEACRIYAEVELADLPVSKGKEAQKWLTGAHENVKRAHEHIGMHIRGVWGAPAKVHPQNVRFQNVMFQNVRFQNV